MLSPQVIAGLTKFAEAMERVANAIVETATAEKEIVLDDRGNAVGSRTKRKGK